MQSVPTQPTPTFGQLGQQPTVIVAPAPVSNVREHYASNQAMGLGCTQLIMGILAFVFQIISIAIQADVTYTGAGIWCGIIVC